jgi:ATP-dependent DNA ligase
VTARLSYSPLSREFQAPYGEVWLHEIKHDGFRVIARKDGARVRLYSRPGNNLTDRFPLIVEALARLRSRSCIIDGDAIQRPRFSGDKPGWPKGVAMTCSPENMEPSVF